ncbi:hypothetical protein [Gaoshiqia sp. Z1-71]|uniref:hypothetical protein n=1 Tax=Gaoshiqia hydrogeniformans TaxID=3290090 RepID=UPI003BF871DD
MSKKLGFVLIAGLLAFSSCNKDRDSEAVLVTVTETFDNGKNGWEAVFASYPKGGEENYELNSGITALPEPLDGSKKGFMMHGNNHSDALRMLLAKQVGGLVPGQLYELIVELRLASKYPENSVGAGGSPGAANHLIAYASSRGFEIEEEDGIEVMLLFNLLPDPDIEEGRSTADLGTVGIEGDDFVYTLIERKNDEAILCKADHNGKTWVITGTWSGFEGITTLYYDKIKLTFTPLSTD